MDGWAGWLVVIVGVSGGTILAGVIGVSGGIIPASLPLTISAAIELPFDCRVAWGTFAAGAVGLARPTATIAIIATKMNNPPQTNNRGQLFTRLTPDVFFKMLGEESGFI